MAEESCRVCNGDELGFFFIAHLPECGNGKGGETGVAVCSSVKAAQLVVLIMAKHYFFGIAFFQKLCHNGKAEEVIKAPTIVKALIELMAGAVDISPAVKVNIHAHIKQLRSKIGYRCSGFRGIGKISLGIRIILAVG